MKFKDLYISGGKRANIINSKEYGMECFLDGSEVSDYDWWVGFGKDSTCRFEGTWEHMVETAIQILSSENTKKISPEIYEKFKRSGLT